ncbi:hypothetical protein COT42_03315 [Candidatus Saganbacteria bacterium CG08_land_8_20_14_0_20_45_16]|uniref:FAD:protein FMN transferase n=1 Tax=Candidatus Saganbacteria bacterium CG08_land_8_20_14_0_20_45_16 TaxID=2014293 RepID=A0A2H0XZ25_UNCSA|nr:MAG: hypothetical protein COT42_03315 [Candidatus Saganbacteria bacterium CG08_land_8_20_14_0_20_45_16]
MLINFIYYIIYLTVMKLFLKILAAAIFVALLVVILVKREPQVEKTAFIMGTPVRLQVTGRNAASLIDQALAEMRRLEGMFDWHKPESAINNIHPYDNLPEIKEILELSARINELSGGGFDIQFAGQMNLGGIGKGYAVEKARQLLLNKGIKRAIIDMRSSIAVIGDGWKIGVLDPRTKETECFFKQIILNNGEALATSGQYERLGHIIDPRTGQLADKCLSVTVVGKDAALADALSTAIFVLGPAKGLALAAKLRVGVFIVDKNGETYDNLSSKLR